MFKNTLLKLEEIVRFDAGYFLKNGSWVTVRYIFITGVGLLLSVAFSRLVPKETYGQYQFVITFVSFLSILSLPGLNIVTLRESVVGNDGTLLQAVRKSFWWSLWMSGIALGYAFYLFMTGEHELALAIGVGGLLAPLYYAPNNWYVFYEGKKDFRSSSLRIIFMQICLLILMCGGLLLGFGLSALIALYFLVPALLALYYFFEVRTVILARKDVVKQKPLDMALGMMVTLQKYVSGLAENMTVLFVSFLFGFELLAVYQVTSIAVLAVAGFIGALLSLYFPHIMTGGEKLSLKNIGYSLLAGIPSSLLFLFFLYFLFLPLYGEAYQESLWLGYALTGVVFLLPLKTFLVNFFTVHKENLAVIGANVFAGTVLVVALLTTQSLGFHQSLIISLYSLQLALILSLLIFSLLRSQRAKK